jgi:hypothetical protein
VGAGFPKNEVYQKVVEKAKKRCKQQMKRHLVAVLTNADCDKMRSLAIKG